MTQPEHVRWGLPDEIDVLIAGGGTSGAALAGILARDSDLRVVLLEAGPDYGPLTAGRWPRELLDASTLARTHDWGYSGLAHATHSARTAYDRACVIGGCSAHNGCVALLGHRADYDGWERLGNASWDWASVAPAFERAKQGLRVRLVDDSEINPYQSAFLDGVAATGIPRVRDTNDPDQDEGVAASPVNIYDGIRWNSALGYLDPVRERPNLTVLGDTLVDRVVVDRGRATALDVIHDGQRARVPAARVVLAAGAYGSPAILLRSGVGPADELRALGIAPAHALPGVGRALADHPAVSLRFRGTRRLEREMEAARAAGGWLPDEQTLAKARSSRCVEAFDLHLFAVNSFAHDGCEGWAYVVDISSMCPRSAGAVTLATTDPSAAPLIDHGYLTDPDGEDIEVLVDGIEIAREALLGEAARWAIAGELEPTPGSGRAALRDFVRRAVGIYYHPGCACRMGPASDPLAVVDANGKVHGLDGVYVCDASIFPALMRANTNLPAAMVAEHLAARMGDLR